MKTIKVVLSFLLSLALIPASTFSAQCPSGGGGGGGNGGGSGPPAPNPPPSPGPPTGGGGGGAATPGPGPSTPIDIKIPLKFSEDNPEQITPNNSVNLSITGGTGPYTWEIVSGEGFHLAQPTTPGSQSVPGWDVTTNSENSLIADTCPDKSVTVKITDSSGQTAFYSIECLYDWQLVNTFTIEPNFTKPTGFSVAAAVRIDEGGGYWHLEEEGDKYKVAEYYSAEHPASMACKSAFGSFGYIECSNLCATNPVFCDFWILGGSCATFTGQPTGDFKYPCCNQTCVYLAERYVYCRGQ